MWFMNPIKRFKIEIFVLDMSVSCFKLVGTLIISNKPFEKKKYRKK